MRRKGLCAYPETENNDHEASFAALLLQISYLELANAPHLWHAVLDGEGVPAIELLEDIEASVEQDVPRIVDLQMAGMDRA